MNLRMLESMGTHDAIQELNSDEINVTKVPSLPSWLNIEDHHSYLYEERARPSKRVP